MSDLRPVGVFDSGVGGLSVLHEIRARLPHENLLYCTDSGFAPYGEKKPEQITARSLTICRFLIGQGAKALVIACNTATAAAAPAIRTEWPDIPVVAMEPAVKPATAATRSGVVGVLATTGTLKSGRFAALLDKFGRGVKVLTRPGGGLVEAVERGEHDSMVTRALLVSHLAPMLTGGADVIVLGCTHYVFLRKTIESIVGPQVQVIDTGSAVAARLEHMLRETAKLNGGDGTGTERFWTSGDMSVIPRTVRLLWTDGAVCEKLPAPACEVPAGIV